jgi:hypothetical protein
MKDLIFLVADKDMEHTVNGLLSRPKALGIRSGVAWDIHVHPRRDPGCLNEAHDFLRLFPAQFCHAIVMFDRAGCGREQTSCSQLSSIVLGRLAANGWGDRAQVIVLDPELEVWVWSRSPHVVCCLGWEGHASALRQWLAEQGLWPEAAPKPPKPKEAMLAALRHQQRPYSSAIYEELARKVSLEGHSEPAFASFLETLRTWFPAG